MIEYPSEEYSLLCYRLVPLRLPIYPLAPQNRGFLYITIFYVTRIMLFMRNVNRLIDDFKNQTKHTIWKHLDAMAVNYAVYSTHMHGLHPFLIDYDIYLYCNATNIVIVCIDCCGHDEEHTYNETETLSSLIMAEGYDPCVSTVWRLAKTVSLTMSRFTDINPDINVFGVLLTEAEILNACELHELWESNNIMVLDDFQRLKYRKIRVNDDDDLPYRVFAMTIIQTSLEALTEEKAEAIFDATTEKACSSQSYQDDDEFAKLLEKFVNEGIVDEDAPFDNRTDDDTLDNDDETPDDDDDTEDDDDDVTEDDDDDTSDDDDAPLSGVLFPDGEIEQNQNISVKVEILRPIANPWEELEKLVGCADIKRRMDELVALTSYNKMMREMISNGKQHEVSLHSIFLGRPGTGKTTVCKIFGSLLRQAGALSKGHVVVCDRGTFIGTLWGDEERSMRQVLEMAKGGVLMIDEAYLLNGKHDSDPGKLVIQLMMNILADETQRDIAIVLCGYKEQMMKLLDMNPGLQSRFPNKFEFTDFTVDELLEITQRRIKDYGYRFTTPAWEKYSGLLAQAYQLRDPDTWGNARFITNQLDRIYIQHAARCVKQRPKDKSELLMLTPEDIVPIEIPRQKTKIGF